MADLNIRVPGGFAGRRPFGKGVTANTDRTIRPLPTLPTLGVAGTSFTDPTFGTKIWRVTDANTAGGGQTFNTPSTLGGAWNSDGSRFVVMSGGGGALFFDFDLTNVTYRADITIGNQEEPWFSYTDPGIIYSNAYNSTTGSYRLVKRWDLVHGTNTVVADLDAMYSGAGMDPGGYMGPVMVVDGDLLVCLFGGTGQDSHFLIHHANYGLIDSRILVVQATSGPVTGFTMHGFSVDRTGRLIVGPSQADLTAHPGLDQLQFYDPNTQTVHPFTPPMKGNGHLALGYNQMVNQDCCTASAYDAYQWQFRSLDNIAATSDLIVPVMTPALVTASEHPSWRNARADSQQPYLSSVFRTEIPIMGTVAWRAWDNEILTIATNGSNEVRRHCHHRSVYSPSDFTSQAETHIDPTGRYAIFTSNWANSLGTGRTDVFLVQLSL